MQKAIASVEWTQFTSTSDLFSCFYFQQIVIKKTNFKTKLAFGFQWS